MSSVSVYVFGCYECGEDVEFTGDRHEAHGFCPACGPQQVCPDEVYADWAAEAAADRSADA